MNRYRVIFKVQADGPAENDHDVEKIVFASSSNDAVDQARELVRADNPEINQAKLSVWSVSREAGAGSPQGD